MKLYRKRIGLACVAALGLSLSACGGGGSTAPTAGIANTTGVVQLAGVVVDGYILGATAFVDRNNNGQLDTNEPSAVTKADGSYAISTQDPKWQSGDEHFPVVVKVPTTATDMDTGKPIKKEYVLTAPAVGNLNQKVVVSPVTTMVKTIMDSTGKDRYSAAKDVKATLNLPNVDLFADFNTAKNQKAADYKQLKKVAQVVAQTVANQYNDVYTAVQNYNNKPTTTTSATIADVVGVITNQVLKQLGTINTAVLNNGAAAWDPYTVAVTNVVPVDVYATSLNTAIANQAQSTLAAAQKAQANADAANAKAQTTLQAAQKLLQQAQALQDAYAQLLVKDTYAVAVASSAKVAVDPYASKALKANALSYAQSAAVPSIILKGGHAITVAQGAVFTDSYTAFDVNGNNLNNQVVITGGPVNTKLAKAYTLTYTVTDANGVSTSTTRTVTVVADTSKPVIHLFGSNPVNVNIGQAYVDTGVYVTDNVDQNLVATVVSTNVPNPATVGTYTVVYSATDKAGNKATLTRTVVVKDTIAPVITLNGTATVNVVQNTAFTQPTATVLDNIDKNLVAKVTGTVNTAVLGTYTLTYNAVDKAGNKAKPVKVVVTVIAKPVGVTLTVYDESVWYNAWQNSGSTPSAAKQQKLIAQGVIAGAKIVVDNAKTYTTDAKGQVTIPGIDVGLHDIAMFADGFVWAAISQVTFDPAKKNQFALIPSQKQGLNNGGNSRLLLAINLPAVQPANTVVELSIADAYSNMVYTSNVQLRSNNATQTNYVAADFQNIQLNPGKTISGVMTAREITCDIYGMNCTETNAGSLGKVSFVTQSWNAQQAPAGTVNVVYAATHVTVPVVAQASAQPVIGLNITNSYAAPGTMLKNGSSLGIQLDYTYTDSYGNVSTNNTWASVQTVGVYDAYGAYIGRKVAPGPVQVSLWGITDSYGNPLPIGTVITARMTALEMSYNAATNNNWVTTNVANLGLQTITIQASPYPGFPAQPLPASSIKTQIAVNFPATPPTPATVLTVQSIVPPRGIVMNQGMGVDNWNTATQPGSTVPYYNDYVSSSFVNGVQQAVTFPHTFTTYQTLTGNLDFYVSGLDTYAQARWEYNTVVPVGAIVSYASQITTPLNVSPYQTGNIIKVTPVNGGALTTGGMSLMMFDAYTKVQIWNINVPSNVTSITLPTVPAGIVNHMVKGKSYLLDVDTTVFMGAGSPTNMTQLMYSYGVNPFATGLVNSSREWYVIPNIPYKY